MTERARLERPPGGGKHHHRWAVVHPSNGNIISMSSEAYSDERDAEHGAYLTLEALLHDLDPDRVGDIVATWMTSVAEGSDDLGSDLEHDGADEPDAGG